MCTVTGICDKGNAHPSMMVNHLFCGDHSGVRTGPGLLGGLRVIAALLVKRDCRQNGETESYRFEIRVVGWDKQYFSVSLLIDLELHAPSRVFSSRFSSRS